MLMKRWVLFALVAVGVLSILQKGNATLSSQSVVTISALGNSSNTTFTIGFPFQANSQILVYLQDETSAPYTRTLLQQGSGAGKYTFSSGDPATSITLGTAPSSTQRVVIRRSSPKTQVVDYDETQSFPFGDHEEQMDKTVQILQEMQYDLNNKVGLSSASSETIPTLPDLSPGRLLGYDSSNLTLYPSSAPVSNDLLKYDGTNWVGYNLSNLTTLSGLSTISIGAASTVPQVNGAGSALVYGLLSNSNISSNASIGLSKLATSTANRLAYFNQSGVLGASTQGITNDSIGTAAAIDVAKLKSYVGGSTGSFLYVTGSSSIGTSTFGFDHAAIGTAGQGKIRVEAFSTTSVCAPGVCAFNTKTSGIVSVTQNGAAGAGTYGIAFASGVFSAVPACTGTAVVTGGNPYIWTVNWTGASSTVVNFNTRTDAGVAADMAFAFVCVGLAGSNP